MRANLERQGSQYLPQRNEQESATFVANAKAAEAAASVTVAVPKLSMQEERGDVEDASSDAGSFRTPDKAAGGEAATKKAKTRALLRELGHSMDDESDEE